MKSSFQNLCLKIAFLRSLISMLIGMAQNKVILWDIHYCNVQKVHYRKLACVYDIKIIYILISTNVILQLTTASCPSSLLLWGLRYQQRWRHQPRRIYGRFARIHQKKPEGHF